MDRLRRLFSRSPCIRRLSLRRLWRNTVGRMDRRRWIRWLRRAAVAKEFANQDEDESDDHAPDNRNGPGVIPDR